jgi:hypothetical protein
MYATQFGLMCVVQILNDSRVPKNMWEFLEMTCFPLSIWRLKKYKEKVKPPIPMKDEMVWHPSDKDYERIGIKIL